MVEVITKGDFVWYTDKMKEKYPGRVVDLVKGQYVVEICTNKRKSEGNDLEHVTAKREQLELKLFGI